MDFDALDCTIKRLDRLPREGMIFQKVPEVVAFLRFGLLFGLEERFARRFVLVGGFRDFRLRHDFEEAFESEQLLELEGEFLPRVDVQKLLAREAVGFDRELDALR